jgi:hypothetical protein
MGSALIPDLAMVRRAQAIAAEYTRSRLRIVADRPGNPMRAEIRRLGAALALKAPLFGAHPFNRAYGFSDGEVEIAAEIVDWYAESGVAGSFEIMPGRQTTKLIELLHRRGYRHTGFTRHSPVAPTCRARLRTWWTCVGSTATPISRRSRTSIIAAGTSQSFGSTWPPGSRRRVGRSIWDFRKVNRRALQSSIFLLAMPTSPTAQSIRGTEDEGCIVRCWIGAAPTRQHPARA